MIFAYDAMTADGRTVRDRIEAGAPADAVDTLRGKGLVVLRVRPAEAATVERGRASTNRGGGREIVLFTRQLKMLLEAGAAVVPALEAIEKQTSARSFRRVVKSIRQRVEDGGTLTDALREHPRIFRSVYCSMVAAGEATGTLPQAFDRLASLVERQRQVRSIVVGALTYPALLAAMSVAVMLVLIGFVIPRFETLFASLNSRLPPTTEFMFTLSRLLRDYWIAAAAIGLAALAGLWMTFRSQAVRLRLEPLMMKLPLVGRICARLAVGRVLRIWAAMLRCHVPLLDAIEESRKAATGAAIRKALDEAKQSISSGGRIGRALADSGFVEPVVASAIATGEENGRLTEAVDFASTWIDEDNRALISNTTRLIEPVLLAAMGVLIGGVAMSLFVPLFDLATAGH